MAVLNILRYPDARLHKVAAPITVFDDALKKLVADMTETMYAAPGIGLAATQVDVRHTDVEHNLEIHLQLIAEAAEAGCDLIVFPETSATGNNGSVDVTWGIAGAQSASETKGSVQLVVTSPDSASASTSFSVSCPMRSLISSTLNLSST